MRFTVIILILVLALSITEAQRRGGKRSRARGKGRAGDQCHMKEMEKCLDPIAALGKNDNPTSIIATSKGLDKLCSTIKKDFINCIKDYFKKCGTPLHREVGGLFVDQLLSQANKFCDAGPLREEFLKNSPCMHEKVLSQKTVKEECNNRYLAALTKVTTNKVSNDENIDTICCGYHFWEKCASDLIKKECGAKSVESFKHLVKRGFMGFPEITCPHDLFVPTSSKCQAIIPEKGAKVKLDFSENGLGKYNVANLFSFMFQTE